MIVVAGSTGSVGGALVDLLADGPEPVRALTRRPAAWAGPAVDVRRADADGDTAGDLAAACAGARGAFLMSDEPIVPGARPVRLGRLVDAAIAAGVGHLVVLSVLSGSEGDDVIGRWNAASEARVTGSPAHWTLLRPGRFFANARHWARWIRAGEPVPIGFARRAAAGIDPADVAAVAAAALADPPGHAGRALRLTGPESLTPLEELRRLGEVLGRPLTAVEPGVDAVRRGMLAGGIAPEVVEAVIARSDGDGGEGADPLPTVEELLGRPAATFTDWARRHAEEFTA